MKTCKIYYLNDSSNNGSGSWVCEYDEIKVSDNLENPTLKDVKVYLDGEIELEIFGYEIDAIDYDFESDSSSSFSIDDRIIPWLLALAFFILFMIKK